MAKKSKSASTNEKTVCICPRCRAEHIMLLNWVGKNKPRKYCHGCATIVGNMASGSFVFAE